jgi:putative ABC transport system permease protein
MRQWLSGFVFRIDLTLTPFLTAGAIALAIAVITVFYLTWRAAAANPADVLHHE